MTRSRNSRRGKKNSPRTYSPPPKDMGNSYKFADSWHPSGLSTRLSNKQDFNKEIMIVKKEFEHMYNLTRYVATC